MSLERRSLKAPDEETGISMHRNEAMDILRALVRDGLDANNFSLSGLADKIRSDWPESFADILPAPRDLIGQRSPASTCDVHLKGLQRALEHRLGLGCAVVAAKLRYHSRWLLYLGEPGRESPPRVSIIIPIHNRAWLVDSLIQNCLDQSYSQIEIIVVDDGSTDDTAARLAAFGDRIKLIWQPNGGVSAARNAGVLAATGELLHFLDSDNLLQAEHVEAKVGAFAAIPDADLCYCSATDVSLFGVKPSLHPEAYYTLRDDDTSPMVDLLDYMVTHGYPFLVSSVTMPRHAFLHNGLFDTDLQRMEDVRYWFRLALAGVKVIGVRRRLFYRCRMTDGLNERRLVDDSASIIVCVRNIVDLLRSPERWPVLADYLSRRTVGARWDRLLDSESGAYARDFHILLETISDLPRAGRSSNRSPLPLLVFLWTLGERGRTPEGRFRQAAVRELLANTLVAAMVGAEPLGQADKDDWVCRASKLRAKRVFAEMPWAGGTPKLSSQVGPKFDEAVAFLQSVAGVVSDQNTVIDAADAALKKQKRRPKATIVVPVLADTSRAEATIVSCLAQTVAERIEILVIENDMIRAAFWTDRYPQVRVITSPTAENLVEAHSAGLDAAQAKLIRFLVPGDILDSSSVARQIRTSRRFHNEVAVIEVKNRDLKELLLRLLSARAERTATEPLLSTMLLPRKVLAPAGGFDLVLGDAYQARYLFRLTASRVSTAFVKASSSIYVTPPSGSAEQIIIAALANLTQCLGERLLWSQIPAVVRALSAASNCAVGHSELLPLKTRVLDFTLWTIGELSANATSRSPLASFALCLVGLEWGRSPTDSGLRPPELDVLRSAILNGASGISLDSLGELSLTQALAEASGDPSFVNAAAKASTAVQEGLQYAGLRDALRRLTKSGESASRRSRRLSPKVSLFERLKWKLNGPSSITDDPEFRGRLQLAATNSVAFARFRSDALDKITELDFKTGAQYAQSFLTMSPGYRQFLPEYRRNDEIGDPKIYQYPEIGRFSAATIRYVKFLSDMETLFGSLNGLHIVEVGAGYGGQCRLIMSRFKPATYTIFDLPEMLRLARRYLNTFGIEKAVAFRRPFQRLPQDSADLVISNYAVSEIRRSEQDRYLYEIINPARRGYILYNAATLSDRIERHTGEAPYELADFAARIEGATIETDWPLVVDRDKDLGNALIYWHHNGANDAPQ